MDPASKLLDPAWRHQRAVTAATARASTDGLIKALASKTLTDEQRQALADVLADSDPDEVAG